MNARAAALLVLAQAAIGAAAIFARFALTAAGPLTISALRMAIAAVPVVALALGRGSYTRYDEPTEFRLLLAGGALAVHFAAWIASLQYTSVAVSTLLVCSTPIWTECWTSLRTRTWRPLTTFSIVLAIAGVALVAGTPRGAESPLGIALALCGAIAIAAYLLLVRASDPRYSTLAVVARTYPTAAFVLIGAAGLTNDRVPQLHAGAAWGGIIALALISQLFGHTALAAAVRLISATTVAMSSLIEPLIAAVAAAIVFGETPAPLTAAGGVLILAGIALAIRAALRQPANSA